MSAESASRLGDVVVKRPNGDCLYTLHLSADGVIPDLLAEHCKSAACSARDTVLQALDECREDAEEFTEEVQQRAEQRATGKRGGKKR